MKIVTLKVSELKPYEKNHRTHPKKQVDLLAKNIERFGFTTPVLIDKNNVVIAGHGRLLALKQLNRDEVPCVRMENLSDDEVKALRLADNQIALMGDTDMKLVIPELKELSEELLIMTGFDKDLIIEADENDDVIPENVPARSKLGDLYELGEHRVLCGDSTKKEDVEKLMSGTKADMIFTDPPYNVNYSGMGENTSNTILNDKMSSDSFDQFLLDVFKRYSELSKDGAGWYVFHSSSTQHQFQKAIESAGWKVKNQIIWNKNVASMGWGDYRWKHEPMFYCGKENTQFYGDRTHTTVLDIPKDEQKALKWLRYQKDLDSKGFNTVWSVKRESVTSYLHPTQKPVELIQYAIRNSSKQGDIVVDLFGGSGATLIACEKMNRGGYLIELDEKYVDIIVQRYVDYVDNPVVKCNGKTILWNKTKAKTKDTQI